MHLQAAVACMLSELIQLAWAAYQVRRVNNFRGPLIRILNSDKKISVHY